VVGAAGRPLVLEARGRGGEAEFSRFLQIAMGSASELEYHILLARDLGYLDPPTYGSLNDHIVEVKKMLATLIRTIRK
jgi:four helix bundle protein